MSCPACFSGALHEGSPTGVDVDLDGVAVYYAAPPTPSTSTKAIVILSDVFGHTFVNTRLLADAYAMAGFHVFLPDYFGGTAVPPSSLNVLDEPPSKSTLQWIANGFRMCGAVVGSGIISFIASHGDAVTAPRVAAALAAVRARATALGVARIGAIGFCFGGPYTLRAAAAGSVDAYAVAHPSNLRVPEDALAVAARGSKGLFCCAEHDGVFPPSAIASCKKALGDSARFIDYAGQTHGFAVRGGAHSVAARAQCVKDVTEFFAQAL